jgi:hypothetical protein
VRSEKCEVKQSKAKQEGLVAAVVDAVVDADAGVASVVLEVRVRRVLDK